MQLREIILKTLGTPMPLLRTGLKQAADIMNRVNSLEERGYRIETQDMRWTLHFPDGRTIQGEQDKNADRTALLARALDCAERCHALFQAPLRPAVETGIVGVHLASGMVGEIVDYQHPWATLRVDPTIDYSSPTWFDRALEKKGLLTGDMVYELSLCVEEGMETVLPIMDGEFLPEPNWEESLQIILNKANSYDENLGRPAMLPEANWLS